MYYHDIDFSVGYQLPGKFVDIHFPITYRIDTPIKFSTPFDANPDYGIDVAPMGLERIRSPNDRFGFPKRRRSNVDIVYTTIVEVTPVVDQSNNDSLR